MTLKGFLDGLLSVFGGCEGLHATERDAPLDEPTEQAAPLEPDGAAE